MTEITTNHRTENRVHNIVRR